MNLTKPNRTLDRWFYMLLVPLAWAGCSLLHFRYPGDEYAMYFISSIAGSWIFFLLGAGDIHNLLIPLSVAAVGALVMAVVGCFLAWLRVRRVLWTVLFSVCTLGIFALTLSSFSSIERALGKNGSWWAYICSAAELGVYCAAVLSVAATAVGRLLRRGRAGRTEGGSCYKSPEVLE